MKFLKLALVASLILVSSPLSRAAEPTGKTRLTPPVQLPDGQEFKTWEKPPSFSRTYYVNQAHARASDENPGTEERPFRTVDRAAQVLRPGRHAPAPACFCLVKGHSFSESHH